MKAYAAAAVMIALGLGVSACDQGGAQGGPFGGMAAASPGQFNNPDLAPVAGRDPVDSPATSPGGTATLGSYDGGGAQQ
jgi:hypothetical protein